ncbi:MAG: FKBP-type peptidyl-prolyl cis-trans isomerase [Pseudomonadota bacterium]
MATKVLCIAVCLAGLTTARSIEARELNNDIEKYSHMVGYQIGSAIGQRMESQPIEVDLDIMLEAVRAAIEGKEMQVTREEMAEVVKRLQAAEQEKQSSVGDANEAAGKQYLDENAKRDGVVVLPSGLQYEVIEEGSGPQAKPGTEVVVHYRGTLISGDEFDSSYARGEPARFVTNAVIPGFREALELMKEGAKWKIHIPGNLAYGPRGAGGKIGPNTTLIFDLELVKVPTPKS